LRILVSGAFGFIGKPLIILLRKKGHEVKRLVRAKTNEADAIQWDPDLGIAVKEHFEGFDAVVHLAGENISSLRWTNSKKKKILFSRTVGTWVLSQIFAQSLHPPKVFITPSALGYYGVKGEALIEDDAPAGSGFLSHVCCEWERASDAIRARGSRVVHPRFGMILGRGGGALTKLLPLYRMGLGGKFGDGQHWMSWISLEDAVGALYFALTNDTLEGGFIAASPNPVRQEEFSKTLASLLHRPAYLCYPKWLLHFLLGQMADEMLLQNLRVSPTKLIEAGFQFLMPKLDTALLSEL
jgi:uncharacterized protein (TIGR01777 family)